jgi:hypothetical protein
MPERRLPHATQTRQGKLQGNGGGRWIDEKLNQMIIVPSGLRKALLACALGPKACWGHATAIYNRLPRLFAELEQAHAGGRLSRQLV